VTDGVSFATQDFSVTVVNPLLQVVDLQSTDSGFVVHFNRPMDPTVLNLYATETGGQGPADVTLEGASSGIVHGSMVLEDGGMTLRFIRTGGPLVPDTYTVTLRSAANGFIDSNGLSLDGNGDGVVGDNYTHVLTVAPSTARVLSMPDFSRGAGQPVDIAGIGLPVTLSDGSGVTTVSFILHYNPAMLTVSGATAGAALPAGSDVQFNAIAPGQVSITVTASTALNAGPQELVRLIASVPATVPYRSSEILDISNVTINGGTLAAIGDDALHDASYIGDATGSGTYSSLDATRILRVVSGLDTGFALFTKIDPVILADVTGNGILSSLDATRLLQEVVGLDRPEIPPLPGIVVPPAVADPLVSMPLNIVAVPGETVTVPVMIDDANLLESMEITIAYDTAKFDVTTAGVRKGSLAGDGTLFVNVDDAAGIIRAALMLPHPLGPGSGSLMDIDYQVKPTAAFGPSILDVRQVVLNEGALVLTSVPSAGLDTTDGKITVRPTIVAAALRNGLSASPLAIPVRKGSVEFDYPVKPAVSEKMFPSIQKIGRDEENPAPADTPSIDWDLAIQSDESAPTKKRSRVETSSIASIRYVPAIDSAIQVRLQPSLARSLQKRSL
jgi:hypothetical protein